MKFVSRMSGFGLAYEFALVLILLAGVSGEGGTQVSGQSRLLNELFQLFHLAVGQRVHRINDDCPSTRRFACSPCAYGCINDRDKKAQRLAGSGSRRDDKALASRCLCHRLCLVPVKPYGVIVYAKNSRSIGMEGTLQHKILDASSPFEVWVDTDQRLRPETTARVEGVNLRTDVLGADLGKRARKPLVVLYERPVQIKNIHAVSSGPARV